jgi:hypothetical protein
VHKLVQLVGQAIAYALFAVAIGYFATRPAYTHLDPDKALIKLSFSHAGQRKGECRRLTPEELAELAPNMRRPLDCPRERLPLRVELLLDGETVFQGELPPSGLAGDGASTVYRKFPVAPGQHRLTARLRDTARAEGFDYESEQDIVLEPRQVFVVDFKSALGGFIFL